MKDELNEEIIADFVGLRAKMYSLRIKKEEMKKAKGVKKKVVKKALAIKTSQIFYLKKENLCITCKHYYPLCINSTPSNRIKSPLALTMIKNT